MVGASNLCCVGRVGVGVVSGQGSGASVGDRSAVGCSQGPSATVLMIETRVATRKGDGGSASEDGVDEEQDNGCSHRPSCNVW